MSEYHREEFYKMEHEYLVLKSQRDELLEAVKAVVSLWGPKEICALKQLVYVLAKAEGRAEASQE